MAKRPRPRKRAKSNAVPDKHEQAAIAQIEKHTKEYEDQAHTEEAAEAAEPAHNEAPSAPSAPPHDAAPAHNDEGAGVSSEDEAKPQKKRKRTRKRRKEAKPGPDPASVPGLSEAAQRAIAYAQTYLRDRDAWKFSKPRQNWLIRHILWSERIFHAAKQLAGVEDDTRRTLPEDLQACIAPALQLPDEGAWIPDEHVAVVAVYLQSIMGLGKQRILETLKAAAETKVPSAPEAAPQTPAAVAPSGTDTAESNEEPATKQTDNTATEATAPAADPAVAVHTDATAWNTLRAARAAETLQWIEAREAAT
ncbi:hypothetical protein MBRA1_001806 [Malassezia brasiliensis]|uniref:WKF domain-containing protein n=1 Tax=Malassezia brasiliensis TaxID=1821822 RepID=A0AAF0INJ6_9BASI|nr:hypothetical protein MBRA1_001806 [Malassezia brasiliensis]